jgi:hypothetical protein
MLFATFRENPIQESARQKQNYEKHREGRLWKMLVVVPASRFGGDRESYVGRLH